MTQVVSDMDFITSFPATARVWVYQGAQSVSTDKVSAVRDAISRFTTEWTSHNVQLKATGDLLYNRFLVLMVNEMHSGVSGCSIDASVQFVKQVEQYCGLDFMDRLQFAYLADDDTVRVVHKDELPTLYANGDVDDNTRFFNNLVQSKDALEKEWIVPLGESWMKRFV